MTRPLVAALLIVFAGASFAVRSQAAGAAGSLDPTFGHGGRLVSAVPVVGVADGAVQSDGKILVAASVGNAPGANDGFAIVRYLVNGALDRGFGTRGVAFGTPVSQYNFAQAIAIQTDGKIVVVGNTLDPRTRPHPAFAVGLARFNPNGTLDRSFGTGGLVNATFPGASRSGAATVMLQQDGKIVIGGSAQLGTGSTFAAVVERLNQNGSVDASFGKSGAFEETASAPVNALALLSDGSLLALSATAVVHLSSKGIQMPPSHGGAIVASGHSGPSTFLANGQFALATTRNEFKSRTDLDAFPIRFNADGTVDSTFLSSMFDFSGEGPDALVSSPRAIVQQGDGALLVGGSESSGCCSSVFGVARITSGGPLDPNFGTGGAVTTGFTGNDFVDSLSIGRDGKILAVGHTTTRTGLEIALARYLGR